MVVIHRLSDIQLKSPGIPIIGLDLHGTDSRQGVEALQEIPGSPGGRPGGIAAPLERNGCGQE
jgi:hypothetical protein